MVGWTLMPLTQRTQQKAGFSPGPGPPRLLSQTPRSLQHTSHIKRKQVTQMRQMVLVCDDSYNSFSRSPLPPLLPSRLSFSGHRDTDVKLCPAIYWCNALCLKSLYCCCITELIVNPKHTLQKVDHKVGKPGPPWC